MTRTTASVMDLDLPLTDPLPEATQAYFDLCEEKLGLVPNVLTAHAFDIDKLNAFVSLYNNLMLADSPLTKLEREMIAVVVSARNACTYCLAAHGAAVRALSGDPGLDAALAEGFRAAAPDARARAIMEFALLVTKDSTGITEAHRHNLRTAGLDDRGIWDVASVAAFFNMTNRLASAVDMVPNPEYYDMYRS